MSMAPQFGNLTSVEGGFVTRSGKFQAAWNVTDGGRGYSLSWSTPVVMVGSVTLTALPCGAITSTDVLNGNTMCGIEVRLAGGTSMSVAGGRHRVPVYVGGIWC